MTSRRAAVVATLVALGVALALLDRSLVPLALPFAALTAAALIPRVSARVRVLVALPAFVIGLVGAEFLSPRPPKFAGVYQIHIPGAEGLRWDLDLYTNFFGNFDRADSVSVDGRAWPARKAPGVFRILCLGDSQSIGPGVASEQTACHVMGARLADKFPDVVLETINTGLYGGDDLMQWIYFDHILRRLDPDLLLVTWSGRVVPPYGSRTIYPEIQRILAGCPGDFRTRKECVIYGTPSRTLARALTRFYGSRLVRNLRTAFGLGEEEHPMIIPESPEGLGPEPRPTREEIATLFVDDSGRAARELLFVPQIDVSLGLFEPSYFEILNRLAPGRVVDVRPAFRDRDAGSLFADSAHFRAEGHRILGEFLADDIASRGIIHRDAPIPD